MISKKTISLAIFVIVVLIIVAFLERSVLNVVPPQTMGTVAHPKNSVLKVGDTAITASLADTSVLQERGLSGKVSMPENEGMYFIFDHAGFYPFWMKEMNFPLDMIWIGDDMRVVDITRDAPPSSFPQTFVSKSPARYVLEVNAGFAERHGVKIGDRITLVSSASPR